MADYSQLPTNATLKPKPFKAQIEESRLQLLKDLIKLSPIGPEVFENSSSSERKYGITRAWLTEAKETWENTFDWRETENWINSFPNYIVPLQDPQGKNVDIHFAALFSQKQDAIPISFAHGWPGCFLEGLHLMEVIKKKYPDPAELPYHIIVPSLPGYAFSSLPKDVDYQVHYISHLFDKLMTGLGFSKYIAQGGDVGTGVVMAQALTCEGCVAFQLNNLFLKDPPEGELEMDEIEKKGLERGEEFQREGMAYAMEHGTRPGTIGLVLQSSPIALLAWIGEKYLLWTDTDPSLTSILQIVSLYWLTETFPRSIYPYRALLSNFTAPPYVDKPFGYSFFPYDVVPRPGSWARSVGKLEYYKRHESGGHFPLLECPEVFWEDMEGFVGKVWKK